MTKKWYRIEFGAMRIYEAVAETETTISILEKELWIGKRVRRRISKKGNQFVSQLASSKRDAIRFEMARLREESAVAAALAGKARKAVRDFRAKWINSKGETDGKSD